MKWNNSCALCRVFNPIAIQSRQKVLLRDSHVNDQHRLPPMAVPDQVQEVLGVGGGDVQRVDHVQEGLEESRESSVTTSAPWREGQRLR